jgi:hypothetical protein
LYATEENTFEVRQKPCSRLRVTMAATGKTWAAGDEVTVELAAWQQMLASGTGALLTSLSSWP